MSHPQFSEEGSRLQALVRGRVQGVFFRDFTQRHATRLALVGWVRNLSDGGTIEVLAEGSRSALEELLADLRKGPAGATVTGVDVEWSKSRSEFGEFRVL